VRRFSAVTRARVAFHDSGLGTFLPARTAAGRASVGARGEPRAHSAPIRARTVRPGLWLPHVIVTSQLLQRIRTSALATRVLYVLFGGAAGLAYQHFVGCRSGTCPITSNPYISILYGAVLGYLFSSGRRAGQEAPAAKKP
jgi:hypothetical protein